MDIIVDIVLIVIALLAVLSGWRRGALLTVSFASNAAMNCCSSSFQSSLPTSMLKAWRRKLSGPVFSSSRLTK